MPTAIVGTGKIGTAVGSHLTAGGEPVVLVSRTTSQASQLARDLGVLASAADLGSAIEMADAVLFAVWLDPMKDLISAHDRQLSGKVVIDPSNPVGPDGKGGFARTLPDGVSSGSVIAGLLPAGAHYVKAFGTVSAETLAAEANRVPDHVALWYATDDELAAAAADRLISAAGFDPVRAGGADQALRIEMYGELHQFGGLNGRLLTAKEARALLER